MLYELAKIVKEEPKKSIVKTIHTCERIFCYSKVAIVNQQQAFLLFLSFFTHNNSVNYHYFFSYNATMCSRRRHKKDVALFRITFFFFFQLEYRVQCHFHGVYFLVSVSNAPCDKTNYLPKTIIEFLISTRTFFFNTVNLTLK